MVDSDESTELWRPPPMPSIMPRFVWLVYLKNSGIANGAAAVEGSSGLSSSNAASDAMGGEPHSCRTVSTISALVTDATTDTRLAMRYLSKNSFFNFRRFNRSIGLSVRSKMLARASSGVLGMTKPQAMVLARLTKSSFF